jgi:hypothetical protein
VYVVLHEGLLETDGYFLQNQNALASSAPPRIRRFSAHGVSWRTASRLIALVALVLHPPD